MDQVLIDAGVTYPFKPDERTVQKVEKKLNTSLNIDTFDVTGECYERYPLIITKKQSNQHINLLYFSDENQEKYHYVWIKNFNAFMSDIDNHDHRKFFCMKCMTHFNSEDKLIQHNKEYTNCNDNQSARLVYPKKQDAFIQFKNFNNKIKCPFVIYSDFESILVNHENKNDNDNITHNHIPCGYMFGITSAVTHNLAGGPPRICMAS